MNYLNVLNLSPEDNQLIQTLLVVLIALSLYLIALVLLLTYTRINDPARRRLYKTLGRSHNNDTIAQQMQKVLTAADPYIIPKNSKERSAIEARLLHAGYRGLNSVKNYYAIKTIMLITMPSSVFLIYAFLEFKTNLSVLLIITAIAFILPSSIIDNKIKNRQQTIMDGFPDALDLLVACSEAGLGLNAALQRVAQELKMIHPVLAEELNLVNAEIRAGVDRIEALYGLTKRTGLDDVRSFVGLLSQSIILGSSIAQSLRIYSDDFRDKRLQKAEEFAAKLSTKMIFPMVLCFFPSFFCIAVGPAALKLMLVFGGH